MFMITVYVIQTRHLHVKIHGVAINTFLYNVSRDSAEGQSLRNGVSEVEIVP